MKFNELMTSAQRKVSVFGGKTKLKVEKHAPEILLGIGLVSLAGTVITACRATLKADNVLTEHNNKVNDINQAYEIAQSGELDTEGKPYEYDEELYRRDLVIQRTKTAVEMLRLYAPSVALGTLTIVSILASRNILNRRYLGAVSAYNAVTEAFNLYRKRVREEAGEMMDRHYRFGTQLEEVDTVTVDENGKKHKAKEIREVPGTEDINLEDTARFFDKSNSYWQDNPNISMMFLKGRQNWANDKLRMKGVVFLNEIYEQLGFDPTPTGAIVGWIDNPEHTVQIDFGIMNQVDENHRRFVNGTFDSVLLEFNTQGIIWDKI